LGANKPIITHSKKKSPFSEKKTQNKKRNLKKKRFLNSRVGGKEGTGPPKKKKTRLVAEVFNQNAGKNSKETPQKKRENKRNVGIGAASFLPVPSTK